MNEYTSKVYVLPDERGRVLRCEGGYTMSNIEDISQWVLIDEGYGDRYNLCQSNYFPTPLFEEHGVPMYKLDNGAAVERTAEEIAEDIAAIPAPPPSQEQRIADLETDRETMVEALFIAFGG